MKRLLLFILPLLMLSSVSFAQMPQYYVAGGTGTNVFPFSTSDRRIQNLYLPSDFNATPPVGFITKIYYRSSGSASPTYTNFLVEMANTALSAFPNGTYITPMTPVIGPTTSYIMSPVTGGASGGNTGWAELPLQTPFFYDNTQNLIVNVQQSSASGGFAVWTTTMGSARRIYGTSAATTGTADNYRYDFGFDIIPGFPCTGVPTTNLTGPDEVCPNKTFSIAFTSFYTGVTRQWQTSANGVTWTNWTGTVHPATGALTDAITTDKWYRCIITCIATNQTFTTSPKLVKIAPFYYCYCDGSKATNAAGLDIGNVKVMAYPGNNVLLDNGNATPFLSNGNANKTYTDFRDSVPAVPMYHDSSYHLLVRQISSSGTFAGGRAAIYIDYNRNGTFDPWERALLESTSQALPNPGMVTDTFTVPDSAGYGLTGMRVILRAGNTDPDTCDDYPEGETEDYLVDLRYRPCDSIPMPGIVQGDTSMCIGYDYILTDTTYQRFRHGLSHSWQVSADAINWTNIANSTGKDTLMRLFTGQPLHYRLRQVCTHTNDTAFTPVHLVNLKPTYKCYCFSQAIGGPVNDSSDIGGFGIYEFSISDGGAHLGNPRAVRKRQDLTDLQPIEMWVDSIYNFHVFHTMPRNQHSDAKITVFADFNNNKKYDIPEERIFTGFTNVGYHTIINKVLIPNAAIVDVPTGLRVIVNNNVSPNVPSDEACGTYTSGETEDYMMIFRRPFNVSVNTVADIRGMHVYPNPTSGKFTLQLYSGSKEVKVKVMTVTGQQVLSEAYSHEGGRFTRDIDLTGYAQGVYMIEVNASGMKGMARIVLQ